MKITRALLVSLLLVSAVSLHADEDCYASATLKNQTGRNLQLSTANLKWGKWCVGPPIQIKNGTEAYFKACGRSASWSGTEGELAYTLEGTSDSRVVFVFDISYSGRAKASVNGTGSINVTRDSGSCSTDLSVCNHCTATVTVTMSAAKQ